MEIDELMDKMSGSMLQHAKEHGYLRCDTCLAQITAPETIGLYASNYGIMVGERPLRLNISYCSDCLPKELRVPTKGATEFLIKAELIDEGGIPAFSRPELLETSKSDEGYEWEPGEVWTTFTGIPIEAMAQEFSAKNSATTPAHVEGALYSIANVDLREYLTEDGELNISEDDLSAAKERFQTGLLSLDRYYENQ